jgi:N-acetyl-gamma-glutamyl-phosphate reductase
MAGKPVPIVFTPHLAPMNRGILSTIYAPLASTGAASTGAGVTTVGAVQLAGPDASAPRPATKDMEAKAAGLRERWADFYKDEPFVRVLPYGQTATTRNVRLSNYCDISIHLDQTGTMLIAVTAIDNMIKGAAGQAIQNMNIVMGFGESVGIDAVPAAF